MEIASIATSEGVDSDAIFEHSQKAGRKLAEDLVPNPPTELVIAMLATMLGKSCIARIADLAKRANDADRDQAALMDLLAQQEKRIAELEEKL